jgi:hypothetical protein
MTDTTQEHTTSRRVGRPTGSRSKSKGAALLDRLLSSNKKEIKEILQAAVDLAHKNEPWAMQAILERCWPKPAGRLTFPMPRLESVADCAACLDALLQAAALGSITPQECAQLSTVVSRTGEALAAKSIEDRLEKLEQAQPQQITSYRKVA